MNKTNELYHKIQQLNKNIKEELFNKGIVVPILSNNNTIKVGTYSIKKVTQSFYNILNHKNQVVLEGINLPQTAILIANKLALGKWLDTDLLNLDKKYGYAAFDELVHKRSLNLNKKHKNFDKCEIMRIKIESAKHKKDYYKKSITINYQKLLEFR